MKLDRRGQNRVTHGDNRCGQRTPLYKVWAGILRRCNNPNDKNFPRYGGRGIKICDGWRDYAIFKKDMGLSYRLGLSIERIDNDGDYEPGNCRWATSKEQARNRRSSRMITFQGETLSLAEWSEKLQMPYSMLQQRFYVLNWPADKAFTTPHRGWGPSRPLTSRQP